MTLKHAQAELKTKQAEMKKMDSGYKKDQDALQAVKASREKLQAELNTLNYEGALSSLLPTSLLCFLRWCLRCVCRWKGGESVGQKTRSVKRSGQAEGEIRTPGVSLPQPALWLQVRPCRHDWLRPLTGLSVWNLDVWLWWFSRYHQSTVLLKIYYYYCAGLTAHPLG